MVLENSPWNTDTVFRISDSKSTNSHFTMLYKCIIILHFRSCNNIKSKIIINSLMLRIFQKCHRKNKTNANSLWSLVEANYKFHFVRTFINRILILPFGGLIHYKHDCYRQFFFFFLVAITNFKDESIISRVENF